MRLRQRLRQVLASTVLGTFLAALPLAGAAHAEKTIITFAHPYAGIPGLVKAYDEAVAEFNRTHPDIEVKIVDFPGGTGTQAAAYTAASIAGTAPDVIHVYGVGTAVDLYNAGITLDLQPFLANTHEWQPQEYIDAFIDMFRWQGHLVGLPSSAGGSLFAWAPDRFEAVGLDGSRAPASLQDALTYTRKLTVFAADGQLTRAGFDPWESWQPAFSLPANFGQALYDGSRDQVTVDTPDMRDLLNWLIDVYEAQGSMDQVRAGGTVDQRFASGRLAMLQTSRGILNRIVGANPALVPGETLMVAPGLVSNLDPKSGALAVSDSYLVTRTTKHPAAAVRFAVDLALGDAFATWASYWPLFSASTAVDQRILQRLSGAAQLLGQAEITSMSRTLPFPAFPEVDALQEQLGNLPSVINKQIAPNAFLAQVQQVVQAKIDARREG